VSAIARLEEERNDVVSSAAGAQSDGLFRPRARRGAVWQWGADRRRADPARRRQISQSHRQSKWLASPFHGRYSWHSAGSLGPGLAVSSAKILTYLQIKSTEAVSSVSTPKVSLFGITKMLIAVQGKDFIVSFITIFGTFVTIRHEMLF